jgi:SAM-dependent methyltransferase
MPMMPWVKSVLAFPAPYRRLMGVLANEPNRRWFVDHVLGAREGDKLVDIGCGPADIIRRLPRVQYVGCDISEAYIQDARKEFGDRAVFIAGQVEDWQRDVRTHGADVVLAHGVLHHVDDDEFMRILEFARTVLKPGGRFVFYEPCYLIWQSALSAFLMSHDRGQHIRKEQEWKDLAGRVFPHVTTNIVTSANRLSYTCIIGECRPEG